MWMPSTYGCSNITVLSTMALAKITHNVFLYFHFDLTCTHDPLFKVLAIWYIAQRYKLIYKTNTGMLKEKRQ
jgi:hypothetical protein